MTDFSFVQVLNDLTSLQISWGIYLCSWLFIFSALTNDCMICRSKLWPINMPWNSINLFKVSFFVKCPELIHRARILHNFISIIIHCEVATFRHARLCKGVRYAYDSTRFATYSISCSPDRSTWIDWSLTVLWVCVVPYL